MTRSLRPTAQIPLDTSPEAHALQSEGLRRLGGQGRSAVMFRLNRFVRDLAASGIRARHPDYSDLEVRFALFRVLFGDDLTRKAWPERKLIDP